MPGNEKTELDCVRIAEVAQLKRGKRTGREEYFVCPLHEDKSPSLRIDPKKNTWYCDPCQSGGKAWKLAAAVVGVDPDDKKAVTTWLRDHGLLTESNGSENAIVATYDYTDENGSLLFQVVRTEPKDFRQRRPDGNGGFVWNMTGVSRVPYHLPELSRAERIFIVEGEKDVDALRRLGLTATTSPGGAGKWPSTFRKYFTDRQHVVVIPDNDEPGRKHAEQVAGSLHGHVASLKILQLEGLSDKGDVSDWLVTKENFFALDELLWLVDNCPEWTPPPTEPKAAEDVDVFRLEDFWSYGPQRGFIFAPTGDLWPGESVNVRFPNRETSATKWLDHNRHVEQMTWSPGEEQIIRDRLYLRSGWMEHRDVTVFNLYQPPVIVPGDPKQATPWVDHVFRIYGDNADHMFDWFAHRVQRPQEKINHVLFLGGAQGIGKDALIEPVKVAIGPWNFADISASQLLGRFNGFVKSVILRINEARDLGDVDRFGFYDHLKIYAADPPAALSCDEKNAKMYYVPNVCGVIITSNHLTDGIYLPNDDRRHFVAWSECTKEDFATDYWNKLYGWYANGGNAHVAAFLRTRKLSSFDPKAPPTRTEAFWNIVNANRPPENAELADAIEALNNPDALTIDDLIPHAGSLADWLKDRRNSRQIPHRLEEINYVSIRNPYAKDQQWVVNGKRRAIYVRKTLSLRDRFAAATNLSERGY